MTAGDIVRALLRAGSSDYAGGPGAIYLALVEGFSEYRDGSADSIAGVSTPDDHTLRVQATRPDRSIEHLFAMPFTAPIPPLPGDPGAFLGAATGHPFSSPSDFRRAPSQEGYGRFLVATGPYMIEGSSELDLSDAPERQTPISGFSGGFLFEDPGTITLVRNPSWDPRSDPNRPALAARMEISIAPEENPYPSLQAGTVDVVMGEDPPPDLLQRYEDSPAMRDLMARVTGNSTFFVALNVAQPPFDDVSVRRAVALILDRGALASEAGEGGPRSIAST